MVLIMVLGFNHNVRYKGEMFHVQTEDSGIASPHIITLLYRGGGILASKKTSYADILKMENLDTIVEELMKDQHKAMMRRLKAGEFDQRAFRNPPSAKESDNGGHSAPPADIAASTPLASQPTSNAKSDPLLLQPSAQRLESAPGQQQAGSNNAAKNIISLDDAILSFFTTDQK